MLDAIELLARAGIECDREAMELPAWFHDARLVLVTKTHKVSDDDVNGAVRRVRRRLRRRFQAGSRASARLVAGRNAFPHGNRP